MMFLDPTKPIATCSSDSCEGCPVSDKVNCHFRPWQLIHFMLMSLPTFLLGGAGVYHWSPWLIAPWLAMIVGFFGFLEIKVLCSHCPHYAEPGGSLKCWANYGAPKLWRYRPGPLSAAENSVLLGGFLLIWGYPLYFVWIERLWFLGLVYLVSVGAMASTISMFLCTRCMNFACPLNRVDRLTREAFFERNLVVARAWGHGRPDSEPDQSGQS